MLLCTTQIPAPKPPVPCIQLHGKACTDSQTCIGGSKAGVLHDSRPVCICCIQVALVDSLDSEAGGCEVQCAQRRICKQAWCSHQTSQFQQGCNEKYVRCRRGQWHHIVVCRHKKLLESLILLLHDSITKLEMTIRLATATAVVLM